jgi:uncharacterized protein YdaU (DUF1376 family)
MTKSPMKTGDEGEGEDMNWYARYYGDYGRDTAELTLIEHGAYTLLLDQYYATGGKLPVESAALYRICRAFTKDEQQAVDTVAGRFFAVSEVDGVRHNGRADREMQRAQAVNEKRTAAATRRWGSTRRGGGGVAVPQFEAMVLPGGGLIDGDDQPPAAAKTTAPAKFEPPEWLMNAPGYTPDLWKAWMDTRRRKRAATTPHALGLLVRKLEQRKDKAVEAVQMAVEAGWTSFEWDWFDTRKSGGVGRGNVAGGVGGIGQQQQKETAHSINLRIQAARAEIAALPSYDNDRTEAQKERALSLRAKIRDWNKQLVGVA